MFHDTVIAIALSFVRLLSNQIN